MNLVLDAGNTAIKAGIFSDGELQGGIQELSYELLPEFVRTTGASHVIISNVSNQALNEIKAALYLDHKTPLPLIIEYDTPETLGVDRIAAAVGASVLYSGNSLVIDAGTCVTSDLVQEGTRFLGGTIAPGAVMRAKAMHNFTANLPEINVDDQEVEFVGKTTKGAMLSGVLNGMTFELQGMIDHHKENYPDLRVFLCGGEAKLFENRLKDGIFAVPELVLVGLNRILEHNL